MMLEEESVSILLRKGGNGRGGIRQDDRSKSAAMRKWDVEMRRGPLTGGDWKDWKVLAVGRAEEQKSGRAVEQSSRAWRRPGA